MSQKQRDAVYAALTADRTDGSVWDLVSGRVYDT